MKPATDAASRFLVFLLIPLNGSSAQEDYSIAGEICGKENLRIDRERNFDTEAPKWSGGEYGE